MTFIAINISVLRLLGVDTSGIALANFVAPGVFISALFSLGARGTEGLMVELNGQAMRQRPDDPRTKLLLVGMGDRYGEGERLGLDIVELCADDPATGGARAPTREEAAQIADALESGADRRRARERRPGRADRADRRGVPRHCR